MRRRNIKYITVVVLFLLAVIYLIHDIHLPLGQHSNEASVPVISVHDGDTISVIMQGKKEKVRLVGIDAPELGQRPWGKRAKKYLENLVDASGRKVKLEFDVVQRDRYGRLLAYVRTENGEMINLLMVKSGYAVLYTVTPNVRYTNELRQAQKEAREMRLGIWREKGLKEKPSDYRKRHPRT